MHASTRDEWESDPLDELDPVHFYERAAALEPGTYKADGSRTAKVEPMTPEREAREKKESAERREQLLKDMRSGKFKTRFAGDEPGSEKNVELKVRGSEVFGSER